MPNNVDELITIVEPWKAEKFMVPSISPVIITPLNSSIVTHGKSHENDDTVSNKDTNTTSGLKLPILNDISEKITNTIETPNKNVEKPANVVLWIVPTQHDTLFWCLYCIHFGYNDYQQVSRNYGIRLLEVKKKIATWIQENPGRLKQTNYKITKASVQEILSDCLTSQKETNMLSLLAFLSYFNMNVLIMDSDEKLLMEFIGAVGLDNPTYLIQKDKYGKYKVKDEILTIDAVNILKDKCVLLDSYEKPLKSISNYKVDDLEKLARKLGVFEEGKKYKKADLYMVVFEACSFPIHSKPKPIYRV